MNEMGDFAQGCRFFAAGNHSAAEILFRRCLLATPEDANVLNALGSSLDAMGSLDEAAHYLNQACQLLPESAPFHFNRANLLRRRGDLPGSEHAYLEAIQCDPGLAEAYHGLGSLYLEEGKIVPADACLQKAIKLKNGFVPALHNLGQLRQGQGVLDEAEQFYRLSVAGDAGFLPALNSLGMLLLRNGQVEEARSCFEKAIKRDQNYLLARCNLAVLNTWSGNLDDAINMLQQAAIEAPKDGNIHFNLALALLKAGRFNEGWREYEWRFNKSNPVPLRYGEIPRWHGESLVGKSILIHAEQGYGDSLQFIRFVSLLASQGATVLVEGQDRIITPLLAKVQGVAAAFSRGEKMPFKPDYQIPMMSLLLALGVDGAPPPVVNYLHPPEEKMRIWYDKLSGLSGRKVGIAWSGRPEHENDANRSISSELLFPLSELQGISWVSLQFGPHKPLHPPISLFDPADLVIDFWDSAALIAGLDLVITVDSAIAHLAGGLGVPVMLLLPWNSDWRWMHDREDTPWYPSVKIFRQTLSGKWSDVIYDIIQVITINSRFDPKLYAAECSCNNTPKVLAQHDYQFAASHGIPMDDNRFYQDGDGIVTVDEQRWLAAQAVERFTWFELCKAFDDDRSQEHSAQFSGYQVLPTDCGDVLEVGCGPFTQSRTILQRRTVRSLTLLDPLLGEYQDLENCSYKGGNLYGCPVNLLSLPAENLPPELRFDTVICINVLEHVRDAETVLSRMINALRFGGRLVLGEPCHDDYHPSKEFNLAHPIMLKRSFLDKMTRQLKRLYFNDNKHTFYLIGQR